MFEELIKAFDDIFALEDEEITQAMPVIEQSLMTSLGGPESNANIQNWFRECDLKGYTLEDYTKELREAQAQMAALLQTLRQEYGNSPAKNGLLDMIYSAVETYYAALSLQVINRSNSVVGVELVHLNAKLPTYAHVGDQGADIYAPEDIVIEPHTYGNLVSTGIKLQIPDGWAVAIRPRSGMSKNTTLRISNAPATIDSKYTGMVQILFDNIGDEPVKISAGDRIAQFILEKNYQANFTQVEKVADNKERGEQGFGSSGK